MAKPNELAVLQVNGQLYRDWESVMVRHSSMESPFYHFRFTCSEGLPLAKNFGVLRIKPGDLCQVTLAGEAAIYGMVSTRQVFYDARRHYIEIQGASSVLGLAYTSAITKGMEFKDVTYEKFARTLLKPFMPKINFVVEGGQLPQIKFPRLSLSHGMSVLEALEMPLRSLGGVKLSSNVKGDLVAIAGPVGGEDVVVEGKNILEGREIIFNNGMATETYHVGSGPGNDQENGAKVSHAPFLGKKFTGLGNQYPKHAPGVVPQDIPAIGRDHLLGRQNLEHDMMNEDRVTVFATVHGWLRPSGGLWQREQKVRVISPMLLMTGSEELKAKSVTFTQDNERGSRTQLELCNENAMMGGIPQKAGSDPGAESGVHT